MPINVFGQGAVQTAYVSYIAYPNFDADLTLFWPATYTTSQNILAASNSFTPSTTGLSVFLPDATQVSPGMNALITNQGTPSFDLKNYAGTTVGTIADGVTYFIQLTDTSTSAGTWTISTLGAGTSSADAAALAGYGLKALNSPLNLNFDMPTKTTSANLTLAPSDRGALYILTGGESNVYCPDDGTTTVPSGFNVSFNNAGSGIVTFTGTTNTATFNGQTSLLLNPGQTMTLDYDGANYWSVGLGQSTSFAINILDQDLVSQMAGGYLNLTDVGASKLIQQFYCSGGPITGSITIYYPANANTWYISNFCTSSNGSTISVCLGTNAAPIGTPVLIPNGQRIILYAANLNGILTNDLQMYATPTIAINPSTVQFPSGSTANPSITFSSDISSGLYLNATYVPTIASHNQEVVRFSGQTTGNPLILANAGNNTTPTYSFIDSPTFGMSYLSTGSGSVGFWTTTGNPQVTISTAQTSFNNILNLQALVDGQPDIVGVGTGNTGVGIGFQNTTNQIQFYSTATGYQPMATLIDNGPGTSTSFNIRRPGNSTSTGFLNVSGSGGAQVFALGTSANQILLTSGTPNTISLLNNVTMTGGFAGTPATGTMCYYNGTNWVNLPIGSNGQTLKVNGSGIPAWTT